MLSAFGPSLLVSNLPAALQPDTNLFYYDATTENNLIRQAAVTQTGSGTFINGVAWSSTDNLSVDDQQKAILYNNAIDYAVANNIQLGTALTSQQISSLDKPMLWYTEQAVPDPACSFTSTVCGTINALVPQVYLPPNYASATAGGVISGNDVALNFSDSITNTGIIQATNLAVQTASLTNEQRSVDIGTAAYKVQGGWVEYTGTQLQPGGFMSAVNLDVQADRITSIGNAFQVLNTDGTPDAAGTAALLTSLRDQLGSDFTEITPSDNIKTNFIKDTSGPGAFATVIAIVIAIALAVVTAGAGLALVGAVTGTTVAAGSVAAVVAAGIQAAIVGTLSSIATQVITTGSLDIGQALKSGAVSGVIGGATAGVLGNAPGSASTAAAGDGAGTVTSGVGGATPVSSGSWAAAMADKGQFAINTAVRSGISAAVNSAVYGGSFGTAFLNGAVSDLAAVGANGIGVSTDAYTVQNVLGHALLGCAAASLSGSDCAGGAIGGASSALVSPLVRDGLYDGTQTVNTVDNGDGTKAVVTSYSNQTYNAAIDALAAITGGGLASMLGANAAAASNAAVNEAMNNALHTEYQFGPADSEDKTAGQAAGSSAEDKIVGQYANLFGNGEGTTTDSASTTATTQSGSSIRENQTTSETAATGDASSALTAQVSRAADQIYYLSEGSFQTIAGLAFNTFAGTFGVAGGAAGGIISSVLDGTYGTQQGVQQAAQSAFDTASLYTYSPSNPWAQSNLAGISGTLADIAGPLMSIQPLLGEYAAYLRATAVGEGVSVGEAEGASLNYGNQISGYGSTTLTDVNGNPIPTGVPATATGGADSAAAATALTDIKVIGRLPDTAIAQSWSGHDVLNIPDWTLAKNMEWVDSGITNQQLFYMGSPTTGNLVQTTGRYAGQPTVTALEIQRLENAGYVRIGDYYVPPSKVANFKAP